MYSAIDVPSVKNEGRKVTSFTSATLFVATICAGDHLNWSLSLKPFLHLFISDHNLSTSTYNPCYIEPQKTIPVAWNKSSHFGRAKNTLKKDLCQCQMNGRHGGTRSYV
jgi:hypothetical protein